MNFNPRRASKHFQKYCEVKTSQIFQERHRRLIQLQHSKAPFLQFFYFWIFAAFLGFANPGYSLQAGFGKSVITPSTSVPMGGYGTYFLNRKLTRLSKGVHDDLEVGAVSLALPGTKSKLVLVSVDSVGISPAMTKRVKAGVSEKFGKNVEIVLSSSHTHAAPDVVGLWGALPFSGIDEEYVNFMETEIVSAVGQAISTMTDVNVYSSKSNVSTLSTDVPRTSILNSFWFAEKSTGRLIGSFSQWNAHPTILGINNRYISAGYFGAYREYLEKSLEGVHILFSGILGGVYSDPTKTVSKDPFDDGTGSVFDPEVALDDYLLMASAGKSLSDSVYKSYAGRQIEEFSSLSLRKIDFKLSNENNLFRLAMRFNVLEPRNHAVSTIESSYYELNLGEISLLMVPGEIFPEAFEVLENLSTAKRVIPIGIANDWLGYIMTEQQFKDPEFEYFTTLSVSQSLLQTMIDAY